MRLCTVGSRDLVYNFLCRWAVEIGDKWRHRPNDVIVEKVISIDQNSRSQTAMESVWSVSKLSTESVGNRRALAANIVFTPPTPTRRNSTVESRRRRQCVLDTRNSVSFLGVVSAVSSWLSIVQLRLVLERNSLDVSSPHTSPYSLRRQSCVPTVSGRYTYSIHAGSGRST